MSDVLLEIIAFDIASCSLIGANGGNRIELCANPLEGGTTVSYGMMKAARSAASIPIFPIIRPRGGDFLYNAEEFEVMRKDVMLARDCGMDGVVLGLLTANRSVDYDRTAALVELAYPMEVTFHRAFDEIEDYLPALELVITAGCNRILTSGGKPTVMEGLDRLKHCVEAANDRIIVLPGSGIRASNIQSIRDTLGLAEYHSSARYQSANGTSSLDVNELKALRQALS
ncbi:MAG TPA: copper homeostasis protein CutC [Flavihumibacter sp.]|nr:copper homeostasis protein CutC [Bacteroidota bacterium]HOA38954.1 copper homeostasis protein CutC [Flavihumibacter sp.]HPZ87730.1 copper homeostasis protein CutC [Flavihumibacter sp.]HQD08920.1 copper homeostasis protein CutC [Flavihumibacter sp.]